MNETIRVAIAAISFAAVGATSAQEADKSKDIHAVMFEMDYNEAGVILHAQVIGGYPSLEDCSDKLGAAMAAIVPQLLKGVTPQLECSGVKAEQQAKEDEPQAPGTAL